MWRVWRRWRRLLFFRGRMNVTRVHAKRIPTKVGHQGLRYRECSDIASATADLVASPSGEENLQRPQPRLSTTKLPLPRNINGHKANSDLFTPGFLFIPLPCFLSVALHLASCLARFLSPIRGRPVHRNDGLHCVLDKFAWRANLDTWNSGPAGVTSHVRGLPELLPVS